jgi:hypothetical protein
MKDDRSGVSAILIAASLILVIAVATGAAVFALGGYDGHHATDNSDASGYKITYRSNGGEGLPIVQEVQKGESVYILHAQFEMRGYTFESWNTSIDGSGVTYYQGEVIKITSSLTLYAQWS